MNEAVRKAGLDSARQIKTGNWSEVQEFLVALKAPPQEGSSAAGQSVVDVAENIPGEANGPPTTTDHGGSSEKGEGTARLDGVMSIVKPARGCASGSVFLCHGESEAKEAFEKILGTPKYGTPGAINDEVMSRHC